MTAYAELDAVATMQLNTGMLGRSEESLDRLDELNRSFEEKQEMINQLIAINHGYDVVKTYRTAILAHLLSIQQSRQKLEELLQEWRVDDGAAMRQVKASQTTVRSYGGVNYSDAISYYIDEKK